MNLISFRKNKIVFEISREDLGCLGNTLNEVCNGIEVLDFETKIGTSPEQVSNILDFLGSTYRTSVDIERFE